MVDARTLFHYLENLSQGLWRCQKFKKLIKKQQKNYHEANNKKEWVLIIHISERTERGNSTKKSSPLSYLHQIKEDPSEKKCMS